MLVSVGSQNLLPFTHSRWGIRYESGVGWGAEEAGVVQKMPFAIIGEIRHSCRIIPHVMF